MLEPKNQLYCDITDIIFPGLRFVFIDWIASSMSFSTKGMNLETCALILPAAKAFAFTKSNDPVLRGNPRTVLRNDQKFFESKMT